MQYHTRLCYLLSRHFVWCTYFLTYIFEHHVLEYWYKNVLVVLVLTAQNSTLPLANYIIYMYLHLPLPYSHCFSFLKFLIFLILSWLYIHMIYHTSPWFIPFFKARSPWPGLYHAWCPCAWERIIAGWRPAGPKPPRSMSWAGKLVERVHWLLDWLRQVMCSLTRGREGMVTYMPRLAREDVRWGEDRRDEANKYRRSEIIHPHWKENRRRFY